MAVPDHDKADGRYSPLSRVEPVLLCVILLLAGWLRFHHLDRAEFLWDQSEISKWALHTARGQLTWVGPISSTGLDTFPVAIWLWAIPYRFSHNPAAASGFLAALHILTLIGYYLLTRRWFGSAAALLSALLFAAAPWAVIYARKIWHTTLLPPLVLPYITTGWLAFVRRKRWAVVAHLLSLAALIQTHFSTYPFAFLTLLWALIFRKRLDWRAAAVGALLAGLTCLPYLLTDMQRDWRNVHRLLELLRRPSTVSLDALYGGWIIMTGQDLHWLTGAERYAEFTALAPTIRRLYPLLGGLAACGGGLAIWQAIRRGLDDATSAALMTATWLAAPILFLTRGFASPAPHYFTTTLPAGFILIGWLAVQASRRLGRVVGGAIIVSICLIALSQAYETAAVLRFVTSHEVPGYGTPLRYELDAVRAAQRLAGEGGGAEIILLAEGDEPRMYEMPNAADILLYEHPHRAVDARSALLFPSAPAVYWATYDGTPAEAWLAAFTPEIVAARIPLREGIHSFRFYRWPGGAPDIPCMQPLDREPRTWANGAQLLGYCLEQKPDLLRWTLIWRPTQTPGEDVYYHWFNHLLDKNGEMCGQQDGPGVLPAYWRADDTILNWFDIPLPTGAPRGEYTLRVGMYAVQPGSGAFLGNIPLVDASGNVVGEWLSIGPFRDDTDFHPFVSPESVLFRVLPYPMCPS